MRRVGALCGGVGRCGDSEQACLAQAVGIVGGDERLSFGCQLNAAALALGDIVHSAFEGFLTTGAIFGFSLGHEELGYGELGHGECIFEPGLR